MIQIQELRTIRFFQGLPPAFFQEIAERIIERSFSAGETIFHRGDPGTSMFVIFSGSVAVTLFNDEGLEYTITNLDAGEIFGEMALLTGEPRSANVKAVLPARTFEVNQQTYQTLAQKFPELNSRLFHLLVQRLGKSIDRHQSLDLENQELVASLASSQPPPDIDSFLGNSKQAREVNACIGKAAAEGNHAMIIGEPGTGRFLVAQLIHHRGEDHNRPLLHLDCAVPPAILRQSPAGKGDTDAQMLRGIAQEAALFGHKANTSQFAQGARRGLLDLANGGTLILENVEELCPRVQELLCACLEEGRFCRQGDPEPRTCTARILSTATEKIWEQAAQGTFSPDLLRALTLTRVALKPLRERKKDIPVLADYFLGVFTVRLHKSIKGFTPEARNFLLDHDWPLNTDELSQVVERAVAVCQEEWVDSHQVFLNSRPFSSEGRFNLRRFQIVEKLAQSPHFPSALQLLTVPAMLLLIPYSLFGPREDNLLNLVSWAVLWPLMLTSILISARSWCSYCPIAAIAKGMNAFRKRFRTVPNLLRKKGMWVGVVGFAVILSIEHLTHMSENPRATGLLFLAILSGAVITHFLYGDRSWCKHLCPLGRMIGQYKVLSWVELCGNGNVCNNDCRTHECVKSNCCPMGLHPAVARGSSECVFCLSCLKQCSHRAVRIDGRFPWAETVSRDKWELPGGLFAFLLVALVLGIRLPSSFFPGSFLPIGSVSPAGQLLELGVIAGGFLVLVLLASGMFRKPDWKRHFTISGYAYVPLAFAGFFNVYFRQFVSGGENILPWTVVQIGLDSLVDPALLTPNLGTLTAVIPVTSFLGWLCSRFVFKKIAELMDFPPRVIRSHRLLMMFTLALFFCIL